MPLDTTKIRQLREARGWSLEEAARRAGLAGRQTWWMVESGQRPNPSLDTARKMARALGVTIDELLASEGDGR